MARCGHRRVIAHPASSWFCSSEVKLTMPRCSTSTCGDRAPLCEKKTPAGEAGAFAGTSEGEKLDRPGNL